MDPKNFEILFLMWTAFWAVIGAFASFAFQTKIIDNKDIDLRIRVPLVIFTEIVIVLALIVAVNTISVLAPLLQERS